MASSRRREYKNEPDSFCYVRECCTLFVKGVISLCLRSVPTKHIFKFPLVTKKRNSYLISCVATGRKGFATGQKENERSFHGLAGTLRSHN